MGKTLETEPLDREDHILLHRDFQMQEWHVSAPKAQAAQELKVISPTHTSSGVKQGFKSKSMWLKLGP